VNGPLRADRPFVLSVVAGGEGAGGGERTGDRAVDRILAGMRAAIEGGVPYEAQLARATTVRDVAILLASLRAQDRVPAVLQLVGHGSPGRLQLALDSQRAATVLTSAPESCGMLVGRVMAPTRVLLLGCHVGAERPSGYVASGKALLFSLEALTGAYAYAADGPVTADDFGDGFLYDGSLVMSCGKPANPGSVARSRAVRRADAAART
jgi:Domain of unknown function (DUF4347)